MDAFSEQALDALAAAGRRAAEEHDLGEALRMLGKAAAEAAGADAAVIRTPDGSGGLTARAVVAHADTQAAELEGSSFPLAQLPPTDAAGDRVPEAVRRAARRSGANEVVLLELNREQDVRCCSDGEDQMRGGHHWG